MASGTATPAGATAVGEPNGAGLASSFKVGSRPKLHGRAFYESIGSPKYIVAPMVDQSEFAWRMLTRSFLPESQRSSVLAYSPMFHARLFAESDKYRDGHFEPTHAPLRTQWEAQPVAAKRAKRQGDESEDGAGHGNDEPVPHLDGNPAVDRPLFVQFCANDPDYLLAAATIAAPYCDAVDLNLGCPQGIARKGHYGAFLQEDQALIHRLIKTLHEKLPIPVTAKIRILDTKEATLVYARNVLDAGASILTVHGRRREQKGHYTGLADWKMIRFLRENLPRETVLFANGNILQHGDLEKCLEATGADGVMSAEGNLSDPAIFAEPPPPGQEGREYWRGRDGRGGWRVDAVVRRYFDIQHRYALGVEPPARRPLFVPGDDTTWMQELKKRDDAEQEQAADGPPKKKRKREAGGNGKKAAPVSSPNLCTIQAHLFHLLRHFISRHHDVRDALARSRIGDMEVYEQILDMVELKVAEGLLEYERTDGKSIAEEEAKAREQEAQKKAAAAKKNGQQKDSAPAEEVQNAQGVDEAEDPESSVKAVRECKRPWWVVQPIVRPLPKEAIANGAITLKKEKAKVGSENGEAK